LKLVLNNWPSG